MISTMALAAPPNVGFWDSVWKRISDHLDGVAMKRVERGIALLDASGEADWRTRINVDELRIKDPAHCMVTQVFGSYVNGWGNLPHRGSARSYGFKTGLFVTNNRQTAAWRRRLAAA